ncbi:MAG: hypothetical protein EAZ81_05380 [Verrucomicrobia bacterium]|jgi:hypothetical protein|nr:MAG: hypothetical protein EAZ81_05380 [Verrucomicrobiota bacterium]
MQAHPHLCFSQRFDVVKAAWAMIAQLLLIVLLGNMIALSPHALATWGAQHHQVIFIDGMVVLHHPAPSAQCDDISASLWTSQPSHPDHCFIALSPVTSAEALHPNEGPQPHDACDIMLQHGELAKYHAQATSMLATSHDDARLTRHQVQWSTVFLLI